MSCGEDEKKKCIGLKRLCVKKICHELEYKKKNWLFFFWSYKVKIKRVCSHGEQLRRICTNSILNDFEEYSIVR